LDYKKPALAAIDGIKAQLNRGNNILSGIEFLLRDAAHKGKCLRDGVYTAQGRIPNSPKRITCIYTFDERTVYIHDVFLDDVD
jgi:hypothetical protein